MRKHESTYMHEMVKIKHAATCVHIQFRDMYLCVLEDAHRTHASIHENNCGGPRLGVATITDRYISICIYTRVYHLKCMYHARWNPCMNLHTCTHTQTQKYTCTRTHTCNNNSSQKILCISRRKFAHSADMRTQCFDQFYNQRNVHQFMRMLMHILAICMDRWAWSLLLPGR